MNSLFKAIVFTAAALAICCAHADENPDSINAGTCLDKAQLATLDASAQKNDLLAIRKMRLYYFSCGADRTKLLAMSKKAAEIGLASDVESYASAVEDAYGMAKAFPIFLKAAGMGDSLSQYTVATAYQNGNGVSKDQNAALMWLELGANCHGHTNSDWGLINMRTLANYFLADQSAPLSKLKGLAWLGIVAKSRAGLSSKEEASRQDMLKSLSLSETDMLNDFSEEFATQVGCDIASAH